MELRVFQRPDISYERHAFYFAGGVNNGNWRFSYKLWLFNAVIPETAFTSSCNEEAGLELPYEGAKEMLLVDNVENKEFLRDLLEAMLPAPKKKK
jgi:hypothetical protein